jgi:two-component system chemotaxis response regulator CheY
LGVSVLYIDGDRSRGQVLGKFLTSFNYEVHLAEDGLEGIQKARALQPDLILLDLHVPRMDYLEVIAQLRGSKRTWDIPVIFVSDLAAQHACQLVQVAGARDFITKPFHARQLIQVLRRNLVKATS